MSKKPLYKQSPVTKIDPSCLFSLRAHVRRRLFSELDIPGQTSNPSSQLNHVEVDGSSYAVQSDSFYSNDALDIAIHRHLARYNLSSIYPPLKPRRTKRIIKTSIAEDAVADTATSIVSVVAETTEEYIPDSEEFEDGYAPDTEG